MKISFQTSFFKSKTAKHISIWKVIFWLRPFTVELTEWNHFLVKLAGKLSRKQTLRKPFSFFKHWFYLNTNNFADIQKISLKANKPIFYSITHYRTWIRLWKEQRWKIWKKTTFKKMEVTLSILWIRNYSKTEKTTINILRRIFIVVFSFLEKNALVKNSWVNTWVSH